MTRKNDQANRPPLSTRQLLAIVLATTALGGCGNDYNSLANHPLYPYGTVYATGYASGDYGMGGNFDPSSLYYGSQQGFQCPASPNIVPAGGTNGVGGRDAYTACPNPQLPTALLVHGQTTVSTVVCVFPAQVSAGASQAYAEPDPSTGLPLYQCVDTSLLPDPTEGIQFQFSTTFNAVFIVEGPDATTMQQCLASGVPSACPPYSYGKFM